MTGRKPTPISVANNLHRSNDEKEERLDNEPKGCSSELKPPTSLSKMARKEWNRLIKLYKELDTPILNDLDLGLLVAYCEARAIYTAAEEQLKLNSDLVVFTDKGIAENPYIKIMERQGQLISKYGEQLALSPVGRARFGMAKTKKEVEEDPMTAVLSRSRA